MKGNFYLLWTWPDADRQTLFTILSEPIWERGVPALPDDPALPAELADPDLRLPGNCPDHATLDYDVGDWLTEVRVTGGVPAETGAPEAAWVAGERFVRETSERYRHEWLGRLADEAARRRAPPYFATGGLPD